MKNEVRYNKRDFDIIGNLKLVWEGQGVVAKHLLSFKDVFKKVNSFSELHVITDPVYPSYGNLLKRDIHLLLDKLPIKCVFHEWEMYKNYELLTNADCGIIPLTKSNKMAWHKPANKLISFWFAGLPTLVSNTPAYIEIMDKANCKMYCEKTEDWIEKIKTFYKMAADERKSISEQNRHFVENKYSNDSITKSWFNIFEKVLKK
jgi:hypothetical protein